MKKADKLDKLSAGLGETLDKLTSSVPTHTKTAPGQLMSFRNEMATYEDRIAALEAELADAKRTEIPVEIIDPNPWQPRTYFDPQEISELAASIAEVGLIQRISRSFPPFFSARCFKNASWAPLASMPKVLIVVRCVMLRFEIAKTIAFGSTSAPDVGSPSETNRINSSSLLASSAIFNGS